MFDDQNYLPTEFEVAQAAIKTPEVQAILKQLATFNLGVTMPHMHDNNGRFKGLPENLISIEDNLKTAFVSHDKIATGGHAVPVGWRWSENSVKAFAFCDPT